MGLPREDVLLWWLRTTKLGPNLKIYDSEGGPIQTTDLRRLLGLYPLLVECSLSQELDP